jgi:uncharacterized membrane protein YfcA
MDGIAVTQWILPADYAGSEVAYVLTVLAAFLLTGVDKGGFGGVGSLAVPLLMLVMPASLALGMWLPLLVFCDILTMGHYPRQWEVRPILLMAPWVIAGLVIGWLLLDVLDARALKVCVGGMAADFPILEIMRSRVVHLVRRGRESQPWRPSPWSTSPFGLGAGVSTMIAHAAGPFTTIYFLLQRMDPRTFVGTAARFYFVFNSLKIPFYLQRGLIDRQSLILSLWLVPFAPLAIWAGSALNRRMHPLIFVRIIYGLLVVTGFYLVWANV